MTKNKGFTLIEITISILLSSFLFLTMAGMLLYGHKTFEKIYRSKGDMQTYLFFRNMMDSQLKRMTGEGFVISNSTILPAADVKFSTWSSVTAGMGNSNWVNKVSRGFSFYAINPATNRVYRGQYVYDKDNKRILYHEDDTLNQNNALPPLPQPVFGIGDPVLENVLDFQVTNSYNGIDAWEFYSTDVVDNMDEDSRIKNLYLRIYVRLDEVVYNDTTYSFTLDYVNNNVKKFLYTKDHGNVTASVGNVEVITQN